MISITYQWDLNELHDGIYWERNVTFLLSENLSFFIEFENFVEFESATFTTLLN